MLQVGDFKGIRSKVRKKINDYRQRSRKPLYTFNPDRPMNIVVFSSGENNGMLEALIENQSNYKIIGAFFDRETEAMDIVEKLGIKPFYHNGSLVGDSVKGIPKLKIKHPKAKELGLQLYDTVSINRSTVQNQVALTQSIYENNMLSDLAGFNQEINMVFLIDFKTPITMGIAQAYSDKIVNLHHTPLTPRDYDDFRVFTGEDPLLQFLAARDENLFSSVYLGSPSIGYSEVIVSSKTSHIKYPTDVWDMLHKHARLVIQEEGFSKDVLEGILTKLEEEHNPLFNQLLDFSESVKEEHRRYEKEAFVFTAKLIANGNVSLGMKYDYRGLRKVFINDQKTNQTGLHLDEKYVL